MPSNEAVAYLLVDDTTGVITKSGVATMFDVALQVKEGHTIILNPDDISDDTHYWDGDKFALYPPRPSDMHVWTGTEWADLRSPEEIIEQSQQQLVRGREAAIAQVNAVAGKVRRLYVTDIPGQEALYLLKENEARSWLSANDPSLSDYPLIAAEVGITAATADQVAQIYLNLATIYLHAAAALEQIRLGAIAEIERAQIVEDTEVAVANFLEALEAFPTHP
ncbi:hypothetical protein [Paracoccus sp. (in: a-proteobacteria)]|uniref:hypothetical protein n=1 Tax=Paracoccus sp. TaxID=267 RepID=UPI0028A8CDB9|nr:hypothetical protein [Paracoccus sp. (in: a-proteobacteria)]